MAQLPQQYQWLNNEPGPKMIIEALKLYGIIEAPGSANNPTIMAWASEIGGSIKDMYNADAIPWCGLFIAVVAKRADKPIVTDPLWALNWGAFGQNSPQPSFGDVMVFVRKTADGKKAGHVALYLGEDNEAYHVLGGNQSDKVCITRIVKNRLYAARRLYNQVPANVRVIKLSATGAISTNES